MQKIDVYTPYSFRKISCVTENYTILLSTQFHPQLFLTNKYSQKHKKHSIFGRGAQASRSTLGNQKEQLKCVYCTSDFVGNYKLTDHR